MWMKTGPRRQNAGNSGMTNASRWDSDTVQEFKETAMCVNRSAHRTPAKVEKLDKIKETIRQETVSHELRTALQQAMVAEKMSQAPTRQ